jgi:hypothetical protein
MRFTRSIISHFFFLFFISVSVYSQTANGNLKFEKGKKLTIQMNVKTSVTQQVGGKAIDFSANAVATHNYNVINTTADNTTLNHQIQKIAFDFEGMGQKRAFDSDNEKDMADQFGEPVKNILNKKYDVIIDDNGKVLTAKAEKSVQPKTDDRLTIILNMLKDVSDIAYPPQKGEPSFFHILPAGETAIGESWADSLNSETGKFKTTYTLSAITDSAIVVDFKTTASTLSKAMMMGREATTTMNSSGTGTIVLDKATRLVKEKTIITESNGATEAMGGAVPVTAKTTIIIHVNPE